jgi:hypothetical protein
MSGQPYAYAGDDPVNGSDPTGLLPNLPDGGSPAYYRQEQLAAEWDEYWERREELTAEFEHYWVVKDELDWFHAHAWTLAAAAAISKGGGGFRGKLRALAVSALMGTTHGAVTPTEVHQKYPVQVENDTGNEREPKVHDVDDPPEFSWAGNPLAQIAIINDLTSDGPVIVGSLIGWWELRQRGSGCQH